MPKRSFNQFFSFYQLKHYSEFFENISLLLWVKLIFRGPVQIRHFRWNLPRPVKRYSGNGQRRSAPKSTFYENNIIFRLLFSSLHSFSFCLPMRINLLSDYSFSFLYLHSPFVNVSLIFLSFVFLSNFIEVTKCKSLH